MGSRSGADPITYLLAQAAAHKDLLIRAWAKKLLAGDHVVRAKRPRRKPAAK
jgi:hypothetical protein